MLIASYAYYCWFSKKPGRLSKYTPNCYSLNIRNKPFGSNFISQQLIFFPLYSTNFYHRKKFPENWWKESLQKYHHYNTLFTVIPLTDLIHKWNGLIIFIFPWIKYVFPESCHRHTFWPIINEIMYTNHQTWIRFKLLRCKWDGKFMT